MALSKKLEKNASFDDAIDVFKYRGKKYPKDMEMGWIVPAVAEDYEHACRFSREALKKYFEDPEFFEASYVLSSRKPAAKALKEKYCASNATALREPDMVCYHGYKGEPACRYLHEESLENQSEMGAKYVWDTPFYAKHKEAIVPQPWRDAIYKK